MHLILFLLISVPSLTFADSISDSISFKKLIKQSLSFHSDFETKVLNKLDTVPDIDMLELMLATDKYVSQVDYDQIVSEVDSFVNQLKFEIQKMSLGSGIRHVFNRTHKKYLKKYDESVLTLDLFKTGYYNCVTGSCLFAHIFNKLKIPYEVKEMPNHVFIMADPGKNNIPVESTDPKYGTSKPTPSMMQKYIRFLLDYKLLTNGELDSNGLEPTFNKYYFPKTTINYIQLAGLQYHNQGIYNLSYDRWDDALRYFKKSSLLYYCDRNKILIFQLYEFYLTHNLNYWDSNTINHFLTYYFSIPNKFRFELSVAMFESLNKEINVKKGNFSLFDQIYKGISEELKSDTEFVRRIKISYYFEKGRMAIMQNKIDSGMKYVLGACIIEPNNAYYRQTAEYAIVKKLTCLYTSEERLAFLNESTRVYAYLRNNKTVKMMFSINYIDLVRLAISTNDLSEADYQLKKLEKNNELTGINHQKVIDLYTDLSVAYSKQNNIHAARLCIDRGLKIMPSDPALLARRNALR